jgi:DNA mismatch repair protein MutS2
LLACGARGIVTTHATELKLFAHDHSGVRNASVRFDPHSHRPTFELDMGMPGRSLAFPLARTLGLPEPLIVRAETLLSENERTYDRALSELAEARAQMQDERDALARERTDLRALQERAREQTETLERERRVFAQSADEKLTRALREFIAELERRNAQHAGKARVTQGQAALLDRSMETLHAELEVGASASRTSPPPRERERLNVGDTVHVEAFGSEGTVVADYGDTVLVAVGAMQSVVPKLQVRTIHHAAGRKRQTSSPMYVRVALEAAASASRELDVRGKRYAEAEPLVERWIDEASLLGLPQLRLIHGKGSGLLGRGLQELLKGHPAVKSLRYGSLDEGGSGVTVLEMR